MFTPALDLRFAKNLIFCGWLFGETGRLSSAANDLCLREILSNLSEVSPKVAGDKDFKNLRTWDVFSLWC